MAQVHAIKPSKIKKLLAINLTFLQHGHHPSNRPVAIAQINLRVAAMSQQKVPGMPLKTSN